MNIDELALKVGATHYSPAPMRAVRGWSFTFEQLQALIAEYEAAGSEPVIIEEPDYHYEAMGCGLEDRNITDRYEAMRHGWDCAIYRMFEQIPEGPLYERPDPRVAELEAQNARLTELNSQLCAKSNSYVIYNARLEEQNSALLVAIEALSPSTELLAERDRKRDAKLLRIIEQRIQPQDSYQDDYFKAKVHSYNIVNELIKQRESGEWKPELGD